MAIKAGLVGLPNVGKSTLFNALTKSCVPAANYPFCTIEPHLAITPVPDARLEQLQRIYKSEKIIPASATFVDIAGLVKGAASGEGLGNQFLSHIAQVDLILHVVRCFENDEITHTSSFVDPIADYEIIVAELMLKDLEMITKRLPRTEKLLKTTTNVAQKKELEQELQVLNACNDALNRADAQEVRTLYKNAPPFVRTALPVLCAKDFLIIANVSEQDIGKEQSNPHVQKLQQFFGTERVISVCAKIEEELSQLSHEEAQEIMGMYGLENPSLDRVIRTTYNQLGLITFFTCGPKEIHAWPIKKGTTMRAAAGEIHSDLERGFICAEVFNGADLLAQQTLSRLKESGKVRTEGQDYIVQDGDIVLVRFNV